MLQIFALFKSTRFKINFLFLSFAALFVLLIFVFYELFSNYALIEQKTKLRNQIQISNQLSHLIHQIQIERGLSSGFLSSHGEKFKNKLKESRQKTDNAYQNLLLSIEKNREIDINFTFLLRKGLEHLSTLSGNRAQIDTAIKNDFEKNYILIKYYSNLIDYLLSDSLNTAKLIQDASTFKESLAHIYFMYAKEKTGIERAILNAIFVKNEPVDNMLYNIFISLKTEQNTFIKLFKAFANLENIDNYSRLSNEKIFKEVEGYEQIFIKNYNVGSYNVDAAVFFDVITQKIELLKQMEDVILAELEQNINLILLKYKSIQTHLLSFAFILILALLLIWLIIFKKYRQNWAKI